MQWLLTPDWDQGIDDLGERLARELGAGRRVLWLVSGGSNSAASARIMARLSDELTPKLTVSLIDERYGPPEHADSNWQKLLQVGFQPKQARLSPVLQPGLTFQATRDSYEKMLSQALADGDIVIGQVGIGDDGHIAGILPHSVATEPTDALVVAYHSDPYDRLTLSFAALQRLTATYAFVFGTAKQAALLRLATQNLSLADQPAQILKQLQQAYVYNDQVGGEIS
jgi:6-phosphogluconolactonase